MTNFFVNTEKDVKVGGASSGSTSGWAGWAVGGMSTLTSKIYKSGSAKKNTATTNSGAKSSTSSQAAKPEKAQENGTLLNVDDGTQVIVVYMYLNGYRKHE